MNRLLPLLVLVSLLASGCGGSGKSASHPTAPAATEPFRLAATWGDSGAGNGQFLRPSGAAVSGSNLFVVEAGNNRVQKLTTSGSFVTKWGSLGTGTGQFTSPSAIAVDDTGNVYVVEWNPGHCRLQKFRDDGTFVYGWLVDTTAFALQLSSVAVDHTGDIFIAAFAGASNFAYPGAANVWKYANNGILLRQWSAGAGGGPSDMAADGAGNVWIVDWGHWIKKFSPDSTLLATIDNGIGTGNGQTQGWTGVAVDQGGNLFVSDLNNGRVEKFSPSGSYLAQWSVPNQPHLDSSPARGHMAVDGAGNVYLADAHAHHVLKFMPQ